MYCGNNRLDPQVLSGELIIGNRYQCLQRGIGKGLALPAYSGAYEPIDREKIYCGKSNALPRGYDRFGTNAQCFQKGVGVGKSLNRNSPVLRPSVPHRNGQNQSTTPTPTPTSRQRTQRRFIPRAHPIPDGAEAEFRPIIPPAPGLNRWSNEHPNQALLLTFLLVVLAIISSISLGNLKTIKYTLLGPFSTIL